MQENSSGCFFLNTVYLYWYLILVTRWHILLIIEFPVIFVVDVN